MPATRVSVAAMRNSNFKLLQLRIHAVHAFLVLMRFLFRSACYCIVCFSLAWAAVESALQEHLDSRSETEPDGVFFEGLAEFPGLACAPLLGFNLSLFWKGR